MIFSLKNLRFKHFYNLFRSPFQKLTLQGYFCILLEWTKSVHVHELNPYSELNMNGTNFFPKRTQRWTWTHISFKEYEHELNDCFSFQNEVNVNAFVNWHKPGPIGKLHRISYCPLRWKSSFLVELAP